MITTDISPCRQCPRNCGVDRLSGGLGYCRADAGLNIASICIHHGEEPVISGVKGICNVFFAHCNLRCLFCQNHQISAPKSRIYDSQHKLEEVVENIIDALNLGCHGLGFVSPSHMNHQVKDIVKAVRQQGYDPVIVYNTNSYDLPEVIDEMAEIVNVWLPDFKYMDGNLAQQWSDVPDYPSIALQAIKTMYKYAGSTLRTEDGVAVAGMVIRHLVMPGKVGNSIRVLDAIAAHLGTDVALSLMSQYHPTIRTSGYDFLDRSVYPQEYKQVVTHLKNLGFYKGWVQEMDSHAYYRPDFDKKHPFET